MKYFRQEVEELINKHSLENGSNTPDFILAQYIAECLRAFDNAVNAREHWYAGKEAMKEELKSRTPEEIKRLIEIFGNKVTDTTKFSQLKIDELNGKVKNTLDNRMPCPDCGGEGYTFFVNQGEPDPDSKCTTCKGTGVIPIKRNPNTK